MVILDAETFDFDIQSMRNKSCSCTEYLNYIHLVEAYFDYLTHVSNG